MLEHTPPPEHQFLLRQTDGSTYSARDICFADDLQSFGATLEGLQQTADLVSTYAMVFNLSITSHKLRAFLFRRLLPTTPGADVHFGLQPGLGSTAGLFQEGMHI